MTTIPPPAVFRPDVRADAVEIETGTPESRSTALRELVEAGGVEVVTNDETCLEECARLRAASGRSAMPPGQVLAYTDKVDLKTRLDAAGIPVPRFRLLDLSGASAGDVVEEVVAQIGLPAVVKPRRGAYNIGVSALATADELREWVSTHETELDWQVESFAHGRLCHANAIVADGRVIPVVVGAYTGPPLAVMRGAALGSVTVPRDHGLHELGQDLVRGVADAIGTAGRFVLHVEFFVDGGAATVIDVAARAPGALVADVAQLATGVHLEEASFRLQTSDAVPEPVDTGLAAGWVWCAGRTAARTTVLAWNADLDQLVADLEGVVRAPGDGARATSWLAELREAQPPS